MSLPSLAEGLKKKLIHRSRGRLLGLKVHQLDKIIYTIAGAAWIVLFLGSVSQWLSAQSGLVILALLSTSCELGVLFNQKWEKALQLSGRDKGARTAPTAGSDTE